MHIWQTNNCLNNYIYIAATYVVFINPIDIFLDIHIYIHNWPLQTLSQDYGLASQTTHLVCVNFIHKWRNLQSTPNDRFLRNFFMAGLFILRVFGRNLLRRNCRRNFFSFIFCFDVWHGIRTYFLYKNLIINNFSIQKSSYR